MSQLGKESKTLLSKPYNLQRLQNGLDQSVFVCLSRFLRLQAMIFQSSSQTHVDGFDGLVHHSVDDKFSQYYRDILLQLISHLERCIFTLKVSSVVKYPALINRLVTRLCASMVTPSPPASTRRSSTLSRPKRLCPSKSDVGPLPSLKQQRFSELNSLLFSSFAVIFYFILNIVILSVQMWG